MTVVISMLRGVNVGGHNRVGMETLRTVYESLGLGDVRSHIQSGNLVFTTEERDPGALAPRIEDAIERSFGFRPAVILRTCSELRGVVGRNPFASRSGIDASKVLVLFLAGALTPTGRDRVLKLDSVPEEVILQARELFVYYPNGMGRSKLPGSLLEKSLGTAATGRNWNTVTKLLEMAESLEASC